MNCDLRTQLHTLKFGHSLCFDGNQRNAAPVVRPRSQKLHRIPSIPVVPPDISIDTVQETSIRRTLHGEICRKNPGAFRRQAGDDSLSNIVNQRHLMRSLLDIHPVSDPLDIDPPRTGYTFPKEKLEYELRTRQEDFLQPKSPVQERSIGYNSGHIRTILNLDTFGPQHSLAVADARKVGLLPQSPNTDRFQATSRPTTGASSVSSRSREALVERVHSSRTESFNEPILTVQFNSNHGIYEDTSTHGSSITDAHTRGVRWAMQRSESIKKLKQLRATKKLQRDNAKQRLKEAYDVATMIEAFEIRAKSVKPF